MKAYVKAGIKGFSGKLDGAIYYDRAQAPGQSPADQIASVPYICLDGGAQQNW
ncbi:MAG: hypothetical protein PWP64_356 [Candidatus Cloacimonadota bacterium]|nr:hypothetical protein [Candidatus Cloacimonadota bacterium]